MTVTNAVVKIQNKVGTPKAEFTADHGRALLIIVMAGLIGGIIWNLLTWLLGLPSSSSHALFGGLIGAAIASGAGVVWIGLGKIDGVVGKVIMPALFSPVIAGIVAAVGTFLIFKIVVGIGERFTEAGFRWGQIGTASLVSLAVAAWVITLPATAVVGAVMWVIAAKIPTLLGPLIAFAILCALSVYMDRRAQAQKVDHTNVNAEWDEPVAPADTIVKV